MPNPDLFKESAEYLEQYAQLVREANTVARHWCAHASDTDRIDYIKMRCLAKALRNIARDLRHARTLKS